MNAIISSIRTLFLATFTAVAILLTFFLTGCDNSVRNTTKDGPTINCTTYWLVDSLTNRQAMRQIVDQIAARQNLLVDAHRPISDISTPASTNAPCFAAYHSADDKIVLDLVAVKSQDALFFDKNDSGAVWISLEEHKHWNETNEVYIAIKNSLSEQCIKTFGKNLRIINF